MCDIWLAFDYLNSNAAVLNMLIISFDRYFSVTRPLTYRAKRTTKHAILMISCAWILSLTIWTPAIFTYPYYRGRTVQGTEKCEIEFVKANTYLTFVTAILAFYIPVAIMCYLYWRIWLETKKRYRDLTTLFLVSGVGAAGPANRRVNKEANSGCGGGSNQVGVANKAKARSNLTGAINQREITQSPPPLALQSSSQANKFNRSTRRSQLGADRGGNNNGKAGGSSLSGVAEQKTQAESRSQVMSDPKSQPEPQSAKKQHRQESEHAHNLHKSNNADQGDRKTDEINCDTDSKIKTKNDTLHTQQQQLPAKTTSNCKPINGDCCAKRQCCSAQTTKCSRRTRRCRYKCCCLVVNCKISDDQTGKSISICRKPCTTLCEISNNNNNNDNNNTQEPKHQQQPSASVVTCAICHHWASKNANSDGPSSNKQQSRKLSSSGLKLGEHGQSGAKTSKSLGGLHLVYPALESSSDNNTKQNSGALSMSWNSLPSKSPGASAKQLTCKLSDNEVGVTPATTADTSRLDLTLLESPSERDDYETRIVASKDKFSFESNDPNLDVETAQHKITSCGHSTIKVTCPPSKDHHNNKSSSASCHKAKHQCCINVDCKHCLRHLESQSAKCNGSAASTRCRCACNHARNSSPCSPPKGHIHNRQQQQHHHHKNHNHHHHHHHHNHHNHNHHQAKQHSKRTTSVNSAPVKVETNCDLLKQNCYLNNANAPILNCLKAKSVELIPMNPILNHENESENDNDDDNNYGCEIDGDEQDGCVLIRSTTPVLGAHKQPICTTTTTTNGAIWHSNMNQENVSSPADLKLLIINDRNQDTAVNGLVKTAGSVYESRKKTRKFNQKLTFNDILFERNISIRRNSKLRQCESHQSRVARQDYVAVDGDYGTLDTFESPRNTIGHRSSLDNHGGGEQHHHNNNNNNNNQLSSSRTSGLDSPTQRPQRQPSFNGKLNDDDTCSSGQQRHTETSSGGGQTKIDCSDKTGSPQSSQPSGPTSAAAQAAELTAPRARQPAVGGSKCNEKSLLDRWQQQQRLLASRNVAESITKRQDEKCHSNQGSESLPSGRATGLGRKSSFDSRQEPELKWFGCFRSSGRSAAQSSFLQHQHQHQHGRQQIDDDDDDRDHGEDVGPGLDLDGAKDKHETALNGNSGINDDNTSRCVPVAHRAGAGEPQRNEPRRARGLVVANCLCSSLILKILGRPNNSSNPAGCIDSSHSNRERLLADQDKQQHVTSSTSSSNAGADCEYADGKQRQQQQQLQQKRFDDNNNNKRDSKQRGKGSGTNGNNGATATNSSKQSTTSSHHPIQPKSERKAAKTLSILLLVFIVTWLPYNVLVLIKTLYGGEDQVSEKIWNFSYYLCYINSTINPLCYALCNAQFKRTYMRILQCKLSNDHQASTRRLVPTIQSSTTWSKDLRLNLADSHNQSTTSSENGGPSHHNDHNNNNHANNQYSSCNAAAINGSHSAQNKRRLIDRSRK